MNSLSRLGVIGVICLCLGACATPNTSWSQERIQAWTDQNFPMGMSRENVETTLHNKGLNYSATQPNELVVGLPDPPFSGVGTLITFVHQEAGIAITFDASSQLQSKRAFVSLTAP